MEHDNANIYNMIAELCIMLLMLKINIDYLRLLISIGRKRISIAVLQYQTMTDARECTPWKIDTIVRKLSCSTLPAHKITECGLQKTWLHKLTSLFRSFICTSLDYSGFSTFYHVLEQIIIRKLPIQMYLPGSTPLLLLIFCQ